MASNEETIDLPVGRDEALGLSDQALTTSGLRVTKKTTNPATYTVAGVTGPSLVSWNEEISIRVLPSTTPGHSNVQVRSQSWQIVDWGKNRGNVERLTARIRELVP